MESVALRFAKQFGLLACLTVGGLGLNQASHATGPNVVVFFVDDMGWTDWQHDAALNPTGSAVYETPNLLRLASEGVNFTRAYSSAPVCSPTRASLLTGKSVGLHGFSDHTGGGVNTSATLQSPVFNRSLGSAEITVAESLGSSAGGYDTGFIGKWHVGGSPLSNGFDSNIAGGGSGCPCDGEGGFFAGPDGRWSGMPGIDTPGTYPADTYLTDVLSGFAETFITQRAADPDPFFLLMSSYQVHVPLQAPAATVSKYTAKIAILNGQGTDLQGHDNPIYAAMVEEMDRSLGRVLDRLDDPNGDGNTSDSIRDNTIVLFASDNGGLTISELGSAPATENQPLRDGKGSLYEGGIRTPLIASWTGNPAIAQGTATNALAATHDLYPTLLELTGASAATPRNSGMDGKSFAAALTGGAYDRGNLYWHYPHRSNQHKLGGGAITGGSFVSAVADETHKLLYFYETESYELYNLTTDIGETNDVFVAGSEEAFELSLALHAYLKRSQAALPVNRQSGLTVDLPPVMWRTFQGDFNTDGVIDETDWGLLRGLFGMNLSQIDPVLAYAVGDINLDGLIDRFDFAEFKTVYNNRLGAGAFEAMVAGVPEPTSLGGLLSTAALLALRGGRRRD
ncbi:sulfatase [Botrimarina hoheduenensis]|uniref:Arylsulfatase n=1 Tax=Botrimarina hoheduenensis TaxID=2528000 RepID=A0A5C5VWZ2_9BACT|nr:sulfatase [Botrimarina hoheduenensis]TWT43138.1 Arylsulfatase [Botrimarina hoheduenensis]